MFIRHQLVTATHGLVLGAGRFAWFCLKITKRMVSRPFYFQLLLDQVAWMSTRCVVPVAAVVLPTGMIMALQGTHIFRLFGTETLVSSLIAVAMIRELCPVMTGIMMAAQAGSSMAAELGTMRIKEEIDAIEVIAVDSLRLLVVPRVLAAGIVCPAIALIGLLAGICGGYGVSVWIMGVDAGNFTANLYRLAEPFDLPMTLMKSMLFGFIIGFISCYKGYTVHGGAVQVGKAANDSVLLSIIIYLVANYCLTSVILGIKLSLAP